MSNRRYGALALLAILPLAVPALAQTELREHVFGYAPSYFAGSDPSSALEMVNLLPGFTLVEADTSVRGYSGAQGNVLIDGRPPASKQDKLSDTLKRIPVGSIERIELMRPGTAGIDMQGYPLLANVVRKISTAPRIRTEVEAVTMNHGQWYPKLAAEISMGKIYVLDVQASLSRRFYIETFGWGPRNRYKQDFVTPALIADYEHPKYENIWLLQSTYRQPLWGGNARVNGLFREGRTRGRLTEFDFAPAAPTKNGVEREMRFASEFGVQYTHPLWAGGEGEAIAIRRGNGETNNVTNADSGGGTLATKKSQTGETIIRLVERQRGQGWNTEAGIEAALNTLENVVGLAKGGVTVPLPGSNVHLSEQRAEGFVNGTWHVTPDIALEAGVRYEISYFKQRGDSLLTETLGYLKPRAQLTWNVTPHDELRLLVQKDAGQLNFNNFVTSVNVSSNLVTAGNVNLVPYTNLKGEITLEHRFAAGSLVLVARNEQIKDTWDQVPYAAPSGIFDALGNAGGGRRTEFVANLNLPLDWTGVEGFTLQGTATRRWSHVYDPLTHVARRISGDLPYEASATLMEDISSLNVRWGVTFTNQNDRLNTKFSEIQINHSTDQIDAFVEYKPQPEWLVRFFVEDATGRPNTSRTRYIWTGNRLTAPYLYTEYRPSGYGPHLGLNIQRTFGG